MAKYAWLGGLMLAIVVVVGVIVAVNSDKMKSLRIFIWEEYIDPEVYRLFEREFGAKVIEDNYGSNEDMRAKLQAGGAVYDLVVPSDYMVTLLRKDGLLLPIDLSRIPNLKYCRALSRSHLRSWPSLFGALSVGDHASATTSSGDAAAHAVGRPVRADVHRALQESYQHAQRHA